jgi:2-haloalkanoic acid dehalogenase type II
MRYDWITFDCYGTLVDWRAGIGGALAGAAAEQGVELDRDELLSAYMRIEPIVQAGPYRPYREVLCEVAVRVARHFGWDLDPARAAFLPDSLAGWPPFEDTRPTLNALRSAGCRLGILSNVDADLLQGTLEALDVEFDLLITAQEVGAYKPSHAHFVEARGRIGDARWLHAAQSYFHDVVPARELEIPVAWINRLGEKVTGEQQPDEEFPSLAALADRLT